MTEIEEQADEVVTRYSTEPQTQARKLLRRLMAERNIRTTGAAVLLGEEAHTVRRMLNGARAMTLDEMVLIATLGGYSLDEHFLHQAPPARVAQANKEEILENNLGRVFAAIADLLTSRNPNAQPAPSLPTSAFDDPPLRRKAGTATGTAPKRGRGRPRKSSGEDGLPGPQW